MWCRDATALASPSKSTGKAHPKLCWQAIEPLAVAVTIVLTVVFRWTTRYSWEVIPKDCHSLVPVQ
jgi:hypothetical protein